MNIQLGTAPDSWGIWFGDDPQQIPWQRFLDEVASLGYHLTELGPYGYMPTDAHVLRSALDRRGLQIVATATDTHVLEDPQAWNALEAEMNAAGELLAALGAPYFILIDAPYSDLRTGKILATPELDARGWQQLIDTTHRAAEVLRERFGLQLLFHPHAETHVEYEAQIEKFLHDTDPARVNLCFDTGHHAYRGGDAVEFMRQHHARIPFLHLKSLDGELRRKVQAEHIPFADAVALDLFVEPSQGAIDFVAFRDMLREIDFNGYAMVEQDMYPAPPAKPLPIARRTKEYLNSIGIGG